MGKSPTKALKSRKLNSPTAKKFTNASSRKTLPRWISKFKVDSLKDSKNKKTANEFLKPSKIAITKLGNSPYSLRSKTTKSSSKPKLKIPTLGSSYKLPTSKGKTSRKITKQNKKTAKDSPKPSKIATTKLRNSPHGLSSKKSENGGITTNNSSKPNLKISKSDSSYELRTSKGKTSRKITKQNKKTAKDSPKPSKKATTKLRNSPHSLSSKKFENGGITTKNSSKPKLKMSNSGSSDELPRFKGKTSRKIPRQNKKTAKDSPKIATTKLRNSPHSLSSKKSENGGINTRNSSNSKLKIPTSGSSDELPASKGKTSWKIPKQNEKTAKDSSKIATTKLGNNNPNILCGKESENDGITTKKFSKPKLKRFNSGSSDELPTFNGKTSRKRLKQSESFKKYGVIVPSLDEILAFQKELSSYKKQVEEAQNLKEPLFKMPVAPQKSNQYKEQLLCDCKQLTLEEITKYFDDNIVFLQDIISGKNISDRHRRYFDKKRVDNFTTEDLTYNTSTIVFTFEQLDHIISLMQKHFDPEDKKTDYFFKVLMPELCLKIFMETHSMNKREANAYLGKRPVV